MRCDPRCEPSRLVALAEMYSEDKNYMGLEGVIIGEE